MSGTGTAVRLGIDFGTTNSVVVLADPQRGAVPTRFEFPGHGSADTCRTLLCLWHEEERGRLKLADAIGPAAVDAYLDDPSESRLIMSMKSYLAQASFRETRLLGRVMTLESLIARFLARLMQTCGYDPAHVAATVGRPVRFAGEMPDDSLGEARLRTAFAQAGFRELRVALEPEGAFWGFMRRLERPATVLVGDFGGGTSDFSVMRFDPQARPAVTALGQAGVGIAGDRFDARIIEHVIAPLLGRDSTYRVMGGEPLPVPAEWYLGLSRWHRLSLMRTPQTLRAMEDVARTASDPEALRRLIRLIEDQQGQALYRAVGAAKAALSKEERTVLRFAHEDFVVEQEIGREAFEGWIARELAALDEAVGLALERAGLAADAIDHVFLTGGTSLVPAVRRLFVRRFGEARIADGGEFVSVAEGLALMDGT